jgi:hypothetical protein
MSIRDRVRACVLVCRADKALNYGVSLSILPIRMASVDKDPSLQNRPAPGSRIVKNVLKDLLWIRNLFHLSMLTQNIFPLTDNQASC